MSEPQASEFRWTFNRSLRTEVRPEKLSADGGVAALREIDHRLGFVAALCDGLRDGRVRSRARHSLQGLVRTRVLMLAAGYEQQRDVTKIASDPVFVASTSDMRGTSFLDERLPSQSTLARLQRVLGEPENLARLEWGAFDLARRSIAALGGPRSDELTIDVDSTPIDSHGQQPGSMYNGHYRRRCFHPIVASLADTGHFIGGRLRPGNEATNKGVLDFLLPLIDRTQEEIGTVRWIRGDAGFSSNEFLSALEDRGLNYVLRVTNNKKLNSIAEPFLKPPKGPTPTEEREWYVDLDYQSRRWARKRRTILVIQQRPDSLFLHHFFLVTNCWESDPEWLIQHYRERGAMEGRLGDFKGAFHTPLSCTTQGPDEDDRAAAFAANASTFQLYLMADGLLHTLRELAGREVSSDGAGAPSLKRVRRMIIQVPVRMTRGARRVTLIVGRETGALWSRIFERLDRLLPAT